jgi:hypothetical protein
VDGLELLQFLLLAVQRILGSLRLRLFLFFKASGALLSPHALFFRLLLFAALEIFILGLHLGELLVHLHLVECVAVLGVF